MPWWLAPLAALGVAIALWVVLLGGLAAAGRPAEARALVSVIPDCAVLLARLGRDPAVPRSRRLVLGALVAYLALPFDLVPDVVPVLGQLDDALLVGLALRLVLRSAGEDAVRRHWPGPPESLALLLRLACAPAAPRAPSRRRS